MHVVGTPRMGWRGNAGAVVVSSGVLRKHSSQDSVALVPAEVSGWIFSGAPRCFRYPKLRPGRIRRGVQGFFTTPLCKN